MRCSECGSRENREAFKGTLFGCEVNRVCDDCGHVKLERIIPKPILKDNDFDRLYDQMAEEVF